MKKLITAAVLTLSMTGIAAADVAKAPTMMTDTQMDNVVAGATAIEYGLIAALVSLAAIGAVGAMGDSLQTLFATVAGELDATDVTN